MHNFHVIIPARIGSSRLPQKMLMDLGSEPLIVKTAKQALKSNAKQVIVATDHLDILKACEKHGIMAKLTSISHNSGTDRIAEIVNIANLAPDEIVINVQGDEPLVEPELINQLAQFIDHKKANMATIAHKITSQEEIFSPHIVKVVLDQDSNALYFSRAPIPFYRNGYIDRDLNFSLPAQFDILRHIGIYAYTVDFLKKYPYLPPATIEQVEQLEQLRVLFNGYKIAVLQTETLPEAGVDTLEDLQRIRLLLNTLIS